VSKTPSHDHELTHSQAPIWVGQQLNPSCPLYNMTFAFVIDGELHPDLFRVAWQRVLDQSDVLRMSFEGHDGRAVRRIRADGAAATTVLDFGDRADPVAAFHAWCRERSRVALSLGGALVDSVLVRLDGDRTGWYLNQHHLVTDARSTVLLYRQVAAEYEALEERCDRPEPPGPYYPTIGRLAGRTVAGNGRDAGAVAEAREHWAARRSQPGRTVPFYGDDGTPSDTASTRLRFGPSRRQIDRLHRLCAEEGIRSLSFETYRFAVFAALLVAWLSRVSGQNELVVDVPVAGRPTAAAKRALGPFLEVFPFAVTVGAGDSLRTLAHACLDEAHRLLRHALPGTSTPSTSASGNVVLNYLPDAFGPFAGRPGRVEWVHPGHGDSVHALRLQVHDLSGTGCELLFDLNDSVWPEPRRQRGVRHFEQLLDACLEDPDRSIASVDVRTDEERQALATLNARATVSPPTDTVVDRWQAQSEAAPDRIALREGEQAVSAADLRERGEALAAALVAHGVEPGDRVCLLGRRSVEAVVGIIGTLRARATYVPVDPDQPDRRIDDLVRDSGTRLVLAGPGVAAGSTLAGVPVRSIVALETEGRGRAIDRRPPVPADPAYLLYTSGSTGRPKGVLVEHRGLAAYIDWAARRYVRGDTLVFPLCTSLTFDLTVTCLFLPLVTGGRLDVYPEPGGPVDSAVLDAVRANTADIIKLTPAHLSLLRRLHLEASRIRRMIVGGEDFRRDLAVAMRDRLEQGLEIYNEYGPTEAVVGCVVHRFDAEADRGVRVPIGVPIDGIEVAVLNEAGTPVPAGVPGELRVAGAGLARGYLGLNEATAERFHPHASRPGVRWYRTGDLVRVRDAGVLECLGRVDRQIKISGLRVEPGEIEAALQSLPGIEHCAVVAHRRTRPQVRQTDTVRRCVRCGLSSEYPAVRFDADEVCSICRSYDVVRPHAQAYFRTMEDLRSLFEESARRHRARWDCLMLLSGGKDSTYALCRLVDMGLSVYAFTFDNGYISDHAKDNMRRVTEQLGVPLEVGTTPAMPEIFRDSLSRFSNVCQGCFKTIYTLGTTRAHALGIPIVVTGLSRGQMFETRLTEEVFREGHYRAEDVDEAVLAARRVYHRVDDAVSRLLDVQIFQDDRIFETIRFVDFYRYCEASLDEMLAYLDRNVPWIRPSDTGRSTNCLINDVGIHVHRAERGFHNYALPYSWDVRLGHKTRDAAVAELDDDIDVGRVRRVLHEIGADPDQLDGRSGTVSLSAFYEASGEVDEDALRTQLLDRLPSPLVPSSFTRLEALPLTAHGKIDEATLRRFDHQPSVVQAEPPDGPVEEYLVQTWQDLLQLDRVGTLDDFFQLGGTSLKALELMLRLSREYDIDIPLTSIFQHPTIRALAAVAERQILDDVSDRAGDSS